MREFCFDSLLAGAVLALVLAAPATAGAIPEGAGSAAPELRPTVSATAAPNDADTILFNDTPAKLPAPIDAQIAVRLHEIVGAKAFERRIEREAERQAIAEFYAGRGYAPLWIGEGQINARGKIAITRLKHAAADGLDPHDFQVPELGGFADAELLADADIELTISLLTFVRQLAVGRIAPSRVLSEVDYGSHAPPPADILRTIAEARDENAALESFNPPHAGFKALKAKLAELRAAKAQADVAIANGQVLKPGMPDARVPLLRERLGVAGKPGDFVYDRRLANAIGELQRRAHLRPNGRIDGKTLAAINGPNPGKKIETILANMERWRWLPRHLGHSYVMVNIPDYSLKLVHDRQPVWATKIVAGKPQTPTPLLSASMDSIIVNPSWHVPQSIIRHELLPRYGRDPNIFIRMGLEVKRRRNGTLSVVQPPGARNALGRIKFNFTNNFQVYLHDTPQKRLFNDARRAFSHGCMRVQDPTKFAELILRLATNGQPPSEQKINSLFGRGERVFRLVQRPSVHLTYQTAFVDDDGKLELRDDIYGIDARVQALLRSDEPRIAGTTGSTDSSHDLASLQRNKEILDRVERGEAFNPAAYFGRLMR